MKKAIQLITAKKAALKSVLSYEMRFGKSLERGVRAESNLIAFERLFLSHYEANVKGGCIGVF